MQLIVPDVLAEARGLSPGAAGFLLALGFALWGLGWRWHRFWVVFGITLAAGVIGLSAGQSVGGQQVLVVGVLTAVAAGMLALELAKILAFLTGGTAAWMAAQAVLPQSQELWAIFLSGALVGVVLYRLWTMLATSVVGTVVAGHAGLVLGGEVAGFDPVKWAAGNSAALNGVVVALALLGVLIQTWTAPAADRSDAASAPAPHAGDAGKDHHTKPHDPHPPAAAEKHELAATGGSGRLRLPFTLPRITWSR